MRYLKALTYLLRVMVWVLQHQRGLLGVWAQSKGLLGTSTLALGDRNLTLEERRDLVRRSATILQALDMLEDDFPRPGGS